MRTTCPRCGVPLESRSQTQVLSFSCPKCEGHALTLPALRKQSDSGTVSVLWQRAREVPVGQGPGCPTCMNAMTTISLSGADLVKANAPGATPDSPPLQLDVCKPCTLVWFDPGEQEQLASGGGEARERSDVDRAGAEATANVILAQARMENTTIASREGRVNMAADVADWVGGLLG